MATMRIEAGSFYIGQVRYPSSRITRQDVNVKELLALDDDELIEKVFNIPEPISRVRQVEFQFDSGWHMSVIWGTAAMCENFEAGMMNFNQFKEEVETVEIGIWHAEHDIHINPNNMAIGQGTWVEGHANSDRVREILFFLSDMPEPDLGLMNAGEPPEPYDIHDGEDLPDEDF